MKYIIVIGDGMADNPVPELGGITPLEKSNIPVMDRLAAAGITGTAKTVPDGMTPGSDTAILSIFGYNPQKYFTGRSPLEAAGCGVVVEPGETSYRCNMVALSDDNLPYKEKKVLSHSGGSVEGEDALELMAALMAVPEFTALAEKYNITFHPSPGFRHIAVQKNVPEEELKIFHATPPHDHLGEVIAPLLPTGGKLAAQLNEVMEMAHGILNDHPVNQRRRAEGKLPANGLWFWAEGAAIVLPKFKDLHGKSGFVVSAVPLIHGIGTLAGLDCKFVEGATGELDTNYEGKADAILAGLAEGYEFAVGHIEAPDECTHNGDLTGKISAIENLDKRFLSPLVDGLDKSGEDYRLLILSDHYTLTSTRGHDGTPVPYILYDSRGTGPASITAAAYSEKECAKGPYTEDGTMLVSNLLCEEK